MAQPAPAYPNAESPKSMSQSLVLLLSAAAGLSVASIYYCQPMLGVLGADLKVGTTEVGQLPTLTQLGYALGIVLLAPLGDRFDRRRIILIKAAMLTVALMASSYAADLGLLLATSLVIGLAATLTQDIVPAAATLAPPAHRGRIVGTVMTGLLLGILLSRVVSGFVAEHFGWRAMYFGAAGAVGLVGLAVWRGLPRFQPTTTLSYGALMASMVALWRAHPALRRATLAQAMLSVAFSAFWSTLAVMLHAPPFHMGSAAAGAFGLAGAAGALAAPLSGRIADRKGPGKVARAGVMIATASFAVMFLAPLLSPQQQIVLLVVSAIGFDFGIQAALIAHQTIVYGLDPAARSRLNALLITGMFIGMSAGAIAGSMALARFGWVGIVAVATVSCGIALTLHRRPMALQVQQLQQGA